MPINARYHQFLGSTGATEEIQLVQGSPSGTENITASGEFGGATLNIKGQHKDTQHDPVGDAYAYPEDSVYTSSFAVQAAIGKDNPLIIEVVDMTATTDITVSVRPVN